MRSWTAVCAFALVGISVVPAKAANPETFSQLFGQTNQGVDSCLVDLTGDVNLTGTITVSDIIYVLNVIFLVGPWPEPCMGAGDVNCSGSVNSADVIGLINYVFKSGPEPCDVCESESGVIWGCFK